MANKKSGTSIMYLACRIAGLWKGEAVLERCTCWIDACYEDEDQDEDRNEWNEYPGPDDGMQMTFVQYSLVDSCARNTLNRLGIASYSRCVVVVGAMKSSQ
jgi:hypothetical protein